MRAINHVLAITLWTATISSPRADERTNRLMYLQYIEPNLVAFAASTHCPGWGFTQSVGFKKGLLTDEDSVTSQAREDIKAIFEAEPERACRRAIALYGPTGILQTGLIAPLSAPDGFVAEFKRR
jgi:hypothetical protein